MRVSLDFDILIESFISLCIIETVGAIFHEYKPKSFRETGYDIVYLDETWVNQNHCTDYMWLPNDGSDAPKIPSGKDKRLIVLQFDLSQIITPIIDNRHLVVQNSSIIT
jgi:hypothetical protein